MRGFIQKNSLLELGAKDRDTGLMSGEDLQETLKVPDGWEVVHSKKAYCEKEFKSSEIRSQFDFEREQKDSFNLAGGILDLGPVSISYSSESREFRKNNGKSKQALIKTDAECVVYVLRMKDPTKPPATSANFQWSVDEIGKVGDPSMEDFHSLFDMYGMSYPTEIVFGARYGFSSWVTKSKYTDIKENSQKSSVKVEATVQLGGFKGVGVEATAGVESSQETSSKSAKNLEKSFQEVKEFSVGKRIPDTGGVQSWLKDVGVEPMPIRYALASMCDHPALKSKKSECEQAKASYCPDHLQKMEEDISCAPPTEPQCLWDIDCGAPNHYVCHDGECAERPFCEVTMYSGRGLSGSSSKLNIPGSSVSTKMYQRDFPTGKFIRLSGWWEGEIESLRFSGGCDEVVVIDEDACKSTYVDNLVLSGRSNDNEKGSNLPWDLAEDSCAIEIWAKEEWTHGR